MIGRFPALVAALACLALPRQAMSTCPESGEDIVTVAGVEARLELRLADGRLLRLAGLDPPSQTPTDPDLGDTARNRLAAMIAGATIRLHALASEPDRWGRIPVLAFASNDRTGDGKAGIAAAVLRAGLGRYLAEPASQACHDTLLAAETEARLAKLGLWSDPYYAVLAVDDRAGFAERAGTTVLAEGRLAAVQPGPYRTILRFSVPEGIGAGLAGQARDPAGQNRFRQGPYGGHMLVATIMPHAMKTFEARHLDLRALVGRRLLFRGLLDLRFGPRVELASPDQVETVVAPIEAAAPPPSP